MTIKTVDCRNLSLFQSTLPQGEWQLPEIKLTSVTPISIHTPTRGVTECQVVEGIKLKFQSTLPQGEWQTTPSWSAYPSYFNPHSHKGSDCMTLSKITVCQYFNPHSHKGSDGQLHDRFYLCDISIHTPTRGVTLQIGPLGVCTGISIHTPTRGVTKTSISSFALLKFQSTLPQGEWQSSSRYYTGFQWFQSTLPQGEWRHSSASNGISLLFQSTLPQGEWRKEVLLP